MRLYIIAGEASGDLHGAALISALKAKKTDVDIAFWGGDQMKALVGEPRRHIKDLAFMGFLEVVKHLPTILQNFSFCKKDILQFKPDAIVLIDYPGFNMRMAKWARKQGIKVIYYISPQLWAWNTSRVEKIRRDVDRMMVILPFEKDFYAQHAIDVDYVGHPLAERLVHLQVDDNFRNRHQLDARPIIALLPGSRQQEISKVLPVMLGAALNDDYQYVIAGAPNKDRAFYKEFVSKASPIRLVLGDTYQLLLNSHSALVTSGTATLETALLRVPQIVCYKGSWLSYQIAKQVIKVPYISLVNLILDKQVVPELIQKDLNVTKLLEVLGQVNSGPLREQQLNGYDDIISKLSGKKASENAAQIILSELT